MKNHPSHNHEAAATSGAGGAHLGLFGRPRILCNLVDGGGASGGTAAPVVAPAAAPTTAPATPPAAGAAPERTFTQAEVNQIVGDRVARVRAEQTQQAPAAGRTTVAPAASDDQRLADIETRSLFNEHLADHPIPREHRADALDLMRAQLGARPAPEAVSNWFQTKGARIFGSATAATPAPTTPPAPNTPPATVAAAAPNTPGRVDPITTGGLTDIWSLTPDQIDQLGPTGMREKYEQLRNAGRAAIGAPQPRRPTRK